MISTYKRFNEWLALKITDAVSTMTCGYLFCLLAFTGLPGGVRESFAEHSLLPLTAWTSQNFIQLVLLPVIMVSQIIQQRRMDELHRKTDDLHDKHDSLHTKQDIHFSTAQQKEIPMSETKPTTTETVTGAAAPAPESAAPTKESLISKIEAELAAIPHEIVAEIKAAFAALKAHL